MKVLVISSSPRKGGNSDVLCDQFIKGAIEAKNEVEKINLADKNMSPCKACFACKKKEGANCVINDDANEILQKMIEAEVIVMATPVYFYSLSAQLKILIDRCFSKYGEMRKKRFFFIVTAADEDKASLENTVNSLKGFLKCVQPCILKGVLYGTGLWDKDEVYDNEAFEEAYKMGKSLF